MQSSIGNLNRGGALLPADSWRRWRTAFWVVWTVVLLAKIVLATTLDPFGDEAWYWQESRHLALGYSDLPPATALLIRLGETLFGHSTFAMRTPFLLLGALLPLLLVRLTRRVFDADTAWRAGLLTLGLPLLATLGLFALPDVPLTVASAYALDALERSLRTRDGRAWAALGLALAGAFLSHYRAAMLLLTGLAFLVFTAKGRAQWRQPSLWIALGLALLGFVPTLLFNATHDWVGLGFQLVERHPWSFHADALVQPLEQAIVCTPLFYVLMLWAAWQACRRTRRGAPWDWLAVCAVVPIGAYFIIGCFADDTRFRAHWPLPGYLPLVIVVPVLLRESHVRLRVTAVAAFATLALGCVAAFAYLSLAAVPGGAVLLARVKAFPEHFVGWRETAQQTHALLDQAPFRDRVLVADNFMLAAELDFALNSARAVYALDQPINTKHGRGAQLALWQRDENALQDLGAQLVLLVSEPTARRERERALWMQSLCGRIAQLTPIAALDLYDARKRYRWFSGEIPARPPETGTSCPAEP
jgi:hypothetical protein